MCNLYRGRYRGQHGRVAMRMFGPRVCCPNRCELERQLLQTLLPAFNDQGIGRRREHAKNHFE